MGSLFSSPETFVTVVGAVSTGVSKIVEAFHSNAKEVPSDGENNDLRLIIDRLNSEIIDLRSRANADQVKYEEIRQFVNKGEYKIGLSLDKYAIIGPKGAGKSTWLWMNGYGSKPENVVGDGTVELKLSRDISCVDTVGIDFSFHSVMKLMACLIVKRHFPDTLVVCCNAHQVNQAVTVLASLGVNKFYIICLNIETAHKKGNICDAYNFAVYDAISAKFPGVIPVTEDSKLEPLDSFYHTRKVFHNYKVKMDDYVTFRGTQGIQEIMRYWVCRYIYELITVYDGDVQSFLNHHGI